MKNYVYIDTYGCTANQNNSEIMAGLLTQSGHQITNNQDIADIIIINTCVVKGKTENKIKRKIQDIAEIYPDKLTIITGCMPETDSKAIRKLNNNTIVLGTHQLKSIVKLINENHTKRFEEKTQKSYLSKHNEEKILLPKIPKNKLISITQISEGCLRNCTYCKTKLAKGKLFSYDMNKIIKSIESDLRNTAKEVFITSQDNASYGLDKGKNLLPELLNNILNLKHNFKLRLGMVDPGFFYPILDEMIEIYKNPKMYKFLHIPIQSASDNVLTSMKRPHKIEKAFEIINRFRKEFPDITISTDIIAGYPTETNEDFKKNLDFIEKFKPDVFNLSKFSKHKGTFAENLKELPINKINFRTSELMRAHRQTAFENKKKFLNKTINVFVDNKKQGFYEARDNNYNIVLIPSANNILGKNIKVKIKQIAVHHMLAEIIQP